jgi:hypothetical protein
MNNLNPWGQRRDFLKAMAAVTSSLPLWAQAQSSWPTKPVNLVVPFPQAGAPMRLPAPCRPSLPS